MQVRCTTTNLLLHKVHLQVRRVCPLNLFDALLCYSLQGDCWQARVGPKKLGGRMHTEDRGRQRTVTFTHNCWTWTPKTCSCPSESQVCTPVSAFSLKKKKGVVPRGQGLSDPDRSSCSHLRSPRLLCRIWTEAKFGVLEVLCSVSNHKGRT